MRQCVPKCVQPNKNLIEQNLLTRKLKNFMPSILDILITAFNSQYYHSDKYL